MLTIVLILAVLALLVAVFSAVQPSPAVLWVAVVLLSIIELLRAAVPIMH